MELPSIGLPAEIEWAKNLALQRARKKHNGDDHSGLMQDYSLYIPELILQIKQYM